MPITAESWILIDSAYGCKARVQHRWEVETAVSLRRPGLKQGAMTRTTELGDELVERLRSHAEEDISLEEFIEELVNIYEQGGRFLDEGL